MDADIQIPAALQRLLAQLEAPSPSIQELQVDLGGDEYGGFFKSSQGESEDGGRARVRLRVLRAIGNCTSLMAISLNPSMKVGVHSVTEAEARALLEALQQSSHVLEWLSLYGWTGFGSAAACVALAGLVRSTPTLTYFFLQYVELTSEGLGHIAAALRGTNPCSLRDLRVTGNRLIGGGADDGGAQYLANIISQPPTLRTLHMYDIGMDKEGGEIIAKAVANKQSLSRNAFSVGWLARESNESAPVSGILRVLTPPATQARGSRDRSSFQTLCHTPYIKSLWLQVYGSTGLIDRAWRTL